MICMFVLLIGKTISRIRDIKLSLHKYTEMYLCINSYLYTLLTDPANLVQFLFSKFPKSLMFSLVFYARLRV